jgi:CBS domain-containing protein
MAFISEMLGRPVADFDGVTIGSLEEIIASGQAKLPLPEIIALDVKTSSGKIYIPIGDVVVLFAPAIALKKRIAEIQTYVENDQDIFLARDVLDKQIIDTDGIRVVRVNDLDIKRVGDQYFLANVDIGGMGLARRLGFGKYAEKFRRKRDDENPSIIPWDVVELISRHDDMRLKVPGEKLKDLHPADLAEILSDMNKIQSDDFLGQMDVKVLADTLEEVEPDFQASLVEGMPDEKVADVLEEMAPDEAADLLAELPPGRSEDILGLMEEDEAVDVRKLLTYAEDTAGGIMTTEYAAVPPNITADEAIKLLRETYSEAEQIFYVYVTDKENHLLGVFSLSDLVLAKPKTKITDFMHTRVATVNPEDTQDEVAQRISKYNLLAMPVVDENHCLQGVVTADDALDKIIPTAWKKKLPRYYR